LELRPEATHNIPIDYALNTTFYTATTTPDSVPWTGYYTNYNGAKLAISNAYGVWFEIRKRGDTWEAHRRARASLHLNDWPLDGLDLTAIEGIPPPNITRVFGQTTRQRSPSPTPSNTGAAGDDPG
jgi:hypothetical protein